MKNLGIMKDHATQSPMRKFKVIEPTLNINQSERYFGGFHFNQFGTLLGDPISFVTNFEIRTTLIYMYIHVYIHVYIYIYIHIRVVLVRGEKLNSKEHCGHPPHCLSVVGAPPTTDIHKMFHLM